MADPTTNKCTSEDQDTNYGVLSPIQQKRAPSPVPSCVSMKSDWSKNEPINFREGTCQDEQSSCRKYTKVMKSEWSESEPTSSREATFYDEQSPIQQKQAPSPVFSCVSMKSDWSKNEPINFREGTFQDDQSPIQQKRAPSPVFSCVSMKSDWSKNEPINFREGTFQDDQSPIQQKRVPSPVPSCVSMKSDWSKNEPINFREGTCQDEQRLQADLQSKSPDRTAQQTSGQRSMLTPEEEGVQITHKKCLKMKSQCLFEGITEQGSYKLLKDIYTDLYITEGGRGEVNDEHEVRQIERKSWKEAPQGKPIKCNDVFKSGQSKPIRTVLTKGVAGIGKTVSVQKFILDWAEGKANEDVQFIFPIPFRELNQMTGKTLSLMDLIRQLFAETKHLPETTLLSSDDHKVLFIFDGLDECRLPLDFQNNKTCRDLTEPASVDVLLTNLINGNLLPSALLWVTSRPAATGGIPAECIDQLTEVRGFNGPQREEYFRKRIRDEDLAHRAITHLKSSRSLYIMCHIPVLCWLTATVLERILSNVENVEVPRTLTQIYTRFLTVRIDIKKGKYPNKETGDDMIFKLAKLAFEQLVKGNLIFYETDLKECGIDVTEASVYSGLCTQVFREETSLNWGKVFCFVHLSIQEHLAALYVLLCFGRQRDVPDKHHPSQFSALFRAATLDDLHKAAVDLAMQNENGHLDLFLRFLLGLSLDSNQALLQSLLPQTCCQSQKSEQTVQYLKQKIREDPSALLENSKFSRSSSARMVNLFYCLNELNHHAVVEVIDKGSGTLFVVMLLAGEWNTRKFVFKTSQEELDDFDLQKFIKTPEKDLTEILSPDKVLQRLLPMVTASTATEFVNCKLSEKSCFTLASALTSESSGLKELNLNANELMDSGVNLLCFALCHQNCKLEKLELNGCMLSEKSCSSMASALTCSSSSLKELNLSGNDLLDSGVKHLCPALSHPNCKLEALWLFNSKITQESCVALASALSSNSSSLVELSLRYNKLKASDVELLSALAKDPNCKLKTLRWQY